VTFEDPSRLATIGELAFRDCSALHWLFLPASLASIAPSAFEMSGLDSIGVEDGSVSFRVLEHLLVDFEVRSLLWVIGSPESILIPASVEEICDRCSCWNGELQTVEFEPNSKLRSIGRGAFHMCDSLEAIDIPSSVEVLRERCFMLCSSLRTVTFGEGSKLREIEFGAFDHCQSLESVSAPPSVEGIVREAVDSRSLTLC
jgi:hypothetical protein